MSAKKLTTLLYKFLDKLDTTRKQELATLYLDHLTGQQIFIETKEHKKFQIIVVPTEMDF